MIFQSPFNEISGFLVAKNSHIGYNMSKFLREDEYDG